MAGRRWTAERIKNEGVKLNNHVNGGWVTITAHPIFGHGRWVVQIETTTANERYTIGTDHDCGEAIRGAWRWLDRHRDADGRVQVEQVRKLYGKAA